MTQAKTHDLHDFMRQISVEMSAEYDRIQKRASEDPGTAGDQGEENWAELLRDWLPRSYEVVTKGRIISQEGDASPQIDILVLKSSYPKKMLNKKLYLAAGVAAAFECKTTLKASHISEAFNTCAKIKSLYRKRVGTPYAELHSPIVYGLLAHSHSWKGDKSTPEDNIQGKLYDSDAAYVYHPRHQLDILCVADLATWTSSVSTFIGPHQVLDWAPMIQCYGENGSASSAYVGHAYSYQKELEQFTSIGVLISFLSQKLAWEDPAFRDLADYYRMVNIAGSGNGYMRHWPASIYSDEIRSRVEAGMLSRGKSWDEWRNYFP